MSVYPILIRLCLVAALIFVGAQPSLPQQIRRSRSPTPPPMGARAPAQPMRTVAQPMRKPAELIHRQDPININQALLAKASPDDVHVIVSLPKQRAYLMTGEQVSSIARPSGKRGHESPHGNFNVMEKDQNHHSSLYGDFATQRAGLCAPVSVRASICAERDAFYRRGDEMVYAPNRRRSRHACGNSARLSGVAWLHSYAVPIGRLFYAHVKVGTPVEVQP